ncbi:hypothetical protein MtrunA17_Chr5g0415681 [Medicago truncatula]|uniref:Nodule Cysteine-Rich (NCR) secreted peptide n=1 Tax=Medicago truncatula TaxID=3880 RepID=A0A072UDU7_MEDTR|nr:Nodule Cysteine-Rich (NCR) secreted peptide [Medicago truncatula]RHN55251.1 hypothetical protein MtrunA17_Chr5g0415681 [Medicago truncatula]
MTKFLKLIYATIYLLFLFLVATHCTAKVLKCTPPEVVKCTCLCGKRTLY